MRAPEIAGTDAPLVPGSRFGAYRVDELVGRGGMATVYRAEHVHLRRPVALKIPMPELAGDEAFRERFVRESRAAAALQHPNLVTVFDAGELDGVLFIAMQFVEGSDLAALLRRESPLEPGRAGRLIAQVAAALDAAHAIGLVHRDVKPANVLVADDHCYLADFGLTKLAEASVARTATGVLLGTIAYAAPEQIEGAGVDRRADVYALGATAYECLVGQTPFAHRTGAALLYAQLTEAPPRASERRPGLPATVDAVLARALAKPAADRFASCGEFAAALVEALGQPVAAAPAPAVSADATTVVPGPARAVQRVPLPGPLARCRSHRLIGREAELAALRDGLAAARDGRRVVTSLAGEPGIGKSRLAAELAAGAHDAGVLVLYGRAEEDGVVPYEPFVEALRHLCRHADVDSLPATTAALAPLIPELGMLEAPPSAGDAAADRYRMFDAVAQLLAHFDAPVVLVLEDLQWAGRATLLLLRHVLESATPDRLAAIVSYRPLWVGDAHPLPDVLTGLARRHDVRNVVLTGLSETDVDRLAADRLGHAPGPELVRALVERTSGNPLFVEELLRDSADTTTALPETVRHTVRRRLERLSAPTQAVLVDLALLGGESSPATLAAIAGEDTDDALEEAGAAGVALEHDGRVMLAHSLIRDVLVARTPRPERRRAHLRIAESLERRGEDPALIARHFREARAGERALRYLVAAGHAATAAHADERAARLFTEAVELAEAQDDATRIGLLLALGGARMRSGQPRCAESFGAAAELARRAHRPDALAEAALGIAGRFVGEPGEDDAAVVAALEEALAALGPADSRTRVEVLSRLAQGEPDGGARSAEALAMAERLGDPLARLAALAAHRGTVRDAGERLVAGRELIALADSLGELEAAALARYWQLADLRARGDSGARELALLEELAERLQQPLYRDLARRYASASASRS